MSSTQKETTFYIYYSPKELFDDKDIIEHFKKSDVIGIVYNDGMCIINVHSIKEMIFTESKITIVFDTEAIVVTPDSVGLQKG